MLSKRRDRGCARAERLGQRLPTSPCSSSCTRIDPREWILCIYSTPSFLARRWMQKCPPTVCIRQVKHSALCLVSGVWVPTAKSCGFFTRCVLWIISSVGRPVLLLARSSRRRTWLFRSHLPSEVCRELIDFAMLMSSESDSICALAVRVEVTLKMSCLAVGCRCAVLAQRP